MITALTEVLARELERDQVRLLPVDGDIDVALVVLWPGEDDPADGVETLEVGHDQLVVVSRVPFPESLVRIAPERLKTLDLVVGPTGPRDDRILVKLLSRPAFLPEIKHRFADTEAAFGFLLGADAFLLMPERAAVGLPPGLFVRPMGPEPLRLRIVIVADPRIGDDEEAFQMLVRLHAAAEEGSTVIAVPRTDPPRPTHDDTPITF